VVNVNPLKTDGKQKSHLVQLKTTAAVDGQHAADDVPQVMTMSMSFCCVLLLSALMLLEARPTRKSCRCCKPRDSICECLRFWPDVKSADERRESLVAVLKLAIIACEC